MRSARIQRASTAFFFLLGRPQHSTLFPYTTLFRSRDRQFQEEAVQLGLGQRIRSLVLDRVLGRGDQEGFRERAGGAVDRSEEHTSELQSHVNLVCRLLLEKKNNRVAV